MAASPDGTRARLSPFGIGAALVGLFLFVWSLRQAGLEPVAEGIRRVGAGLIVILALQGLRFWVRAWAWSLATDGPEPLPTRHAFAALVAGDALGNLTPLGLFVSEPVKAAFVRPRISLIAALAGIAIENIAYTLSVALVIAAGMVALLFLFDVALLVRQIAMGALIVIGVSCLVGSLVLVRQVKVVSRTIAWLDRRGRAPARLAARLGKLRELEDIVYGFTSRHRGRVPPLLGLELAFHVLGVTEIWFTLMLLLPSTAPTLLTTFVLEAVNRTIMVVFKFVPLRLGVDEVGTELLTRTLGLPIGIGVTMAIIRKARMIVWSAIGVTFLVRRGLKPTMLAREGRR